MLPLFVSGVAFAFPEPPEMLFYFNCPPVKGTRRAFNYSTTFSFFSFFFLRARVRPVASAISFTAIVFLSLFSVSFFFFFFCWFTYRFSCAGVASFTWKFITDRSCSARLEFGRPMYVEVISWLSRIRFWKNIETSYESLQTFKCVINQVWLDSIYFNSFVAIILLLQLHSFDWNRNIIQLCALTS